MELAGEGVAAGGAALLRGETARDGHRIRSCRS
jgi:hypothetical protein